MITFGNRVFKEVIHLNKVIRVALIHYDWCPNKRESEQSQLEDHVRTKGEDGHL